MVGLTEQDFIDLAFAVLVKLHEIQDEYAVAAQPESLLTFWFKEKTVREVITADKQYEAYAKGTMWHEPKLVQKLMSPDDNDASLGCSTVYKVTDFKGTTQDTTGPGDVGRSKWKLLPLCGSNR